MATSKFLKESVPKIREATMENSKEISKLMVRVEVVAKELESMIISKTDLKTLSYDSMILDFLKQSHITQVHTKLTKCMFQLTEADITPQKKEEIHAKCEKLFSDIKEAIITGNDIRANLYQNINNIHLAGIEFDTKQCNLNNDTRILLEALTKTSITNSDKIDNHQQHMQNMDGKYLPEFERIERKNRSFFFSKDCLERGNDFTI